MKTTGLIAAAVASIFVAGAAFANEVADPAMLATLKAKYPKTVFKSVTTTSMPGIFEVVMGKNVAYVEESGRYFLFGHLFDMETQTDLTEGKLVPDSKAAADFSKLPFEDAVVTVKGDGSRKMAVFSDPDCPYCKQLENTLSRITNVTVYTFLMPLQQLHPQARAKAIGVWCSKDRAKAWDDLMHKNIVATGDCDHPVDRTIALAEKMSIGGTPTIILPDGSLLPGAPNAAKLEQMLTKSANTGPVAAK